VAGVGGENGSTTVTDTGVRRYDVKRRRRVDAEQSALNLSRSALSVVSVNFTEKMLLLLL